MLPLKVFLYNTLMKSHNTIHFKNNPLRKHSTTIVGDPLIDNPYLIVTIMKQRFTSRCQGPSLPCQSMGSKIPNGSTSKL